MKRRTLHIAVLLTLNMFAVGHSAFAVEPEQDELTAALLGDIIIPTTTFGRSVRLVNQVAENVTVITKEDIARLQVHSLDQLLLYYPGVLPYPNQFPSGFSVPMVQGLPNRQCLVTLDGIPLSSASVGVIDISLITLANIERIEIIKGPTASLWGRSVGAAINLVTMEPAKDRLVSGSLGGVIGLNQTNSGHVVLSGTYDRSGTGYLLGVTAQTTNGFERDIKGDGRAFYTKLKQQLGEKTILTGIIAKSAKDEDFINIPQANLRATNDVDTYYGIGKLNHQFSPSSEFELSVYFINLAVDSRYYNINPVAPFLPVSGINVQNQGVREENEGIQLSYKYNGSTHWFSTGVDATQSSLRNSLFSLATFPPTNNRTTKKPFSVAGYITGGLDLTEKVTLTASFRYDWYSELDGTSAPSAGLIYKLDDETILRATYGWGYSLPTQTSNSKQFETLWRAQGGLETSRISGLWLKANAFYDRTHNVQQHLVFFDQTPEQTRNLTRQGFEIEARTAPILKTSLGFGYTFTDIYDSDTKAPIHGLPRHQVIGSINWKTANTDITVYSRYVNWNNAPLSNDSLLWDIHLTRKLVSWDTGAARFKIAAQNISSGKQTPSPEFATTPLLVTGGIVIDF